MKVLIDITEEDMNYVVNYSSLPNSIIDRVLEDVKNGQALQISTNGDIVKAIFPDAKIYMSTTVATVYFYEDPDDERRDEFTNFGLEWWNAPYRGIRYE